MKLFHLSMLRLRPDSIIEPGNWGRLLKRYNQAGFGNPWILARELVLESVREAAFPDKPSRLSVTFALESRPDADAYRGAHDPNFSQVLHEVELVDPTLPMHRGLLGNIDWPPANDPFLDPMRTQAIAYWKGEGVGVPEVLSASALRVVACLE